MDSTEQQEAASGKALKLLSLERKDLPLTVRYGDKTYVLVVTKSEKLLLQKPLE